MWSLWEAVQEQDRYCHSHADSLLRCMGHTSVVLRVEIVVCPVWEWWWWAVCCLTADTTTLVFQEQAMTAAISNADETVHKSVWIVKHWMSVYTYVTYRGLFMNRLATIIHYLWYKLKAHCCWSLGKTVTSHSTHLILPGQGETVTTPHLSGKIWKVTCSWWGLNWCRPWWANTIPAP